MSHGYYRFVCPVCETTGATDTEPYCEICGWPELVDRYGEPIDRECEVCGRTLADDEDDVCYDWDREAL